MKSVILKIGKRDEWKSTIQILEHIFIFLNHGFYISLVLVSLISKKAAFAGI